MQYNPPIYTTTRAIEYPRKIYVRHDRKKIHELTITNFYIIMMSQTSGLNIAIKDGKPPKYFGD